MNHINNFINRLLITALITIITLITFKKNTQLKKTFQDKVMSTNFNFAQLNDIYKKYFGGPIPFSNIITKEETVFNEKLDYNNKTAYKDGVNLEVSNNYLVPALDTGLVVFIGEKEEYGKTIIIEQANGIDVWYSHLDNINVNIYEYIQKGSFIGECNKNLYLVFKRNGQVLDYQEFI